MSEDESFLNDFLEAAKLEPDDPVVLFGLANEYLKAHRPDDAIQTLQHLLEVQRDYSAAYRVLGQAYAAKGNTAAAMETYEAGILIATQKGDLQTKKEMEIFLKRLKET